MIWWQFIIVVGILLYVALGFAKDKESNKMRERIEDLHIKMDRAQKQLKEIERQTAHLQYAELAHKQNQEDANEEEADSPLPTILDSTLPSPSQSPPED